MTDLPLAQAFSTAPLAAGTHRSRALMPGFPGGVAILAAPHGPRACSSRSSCSSRRRAEPS
ncbi:hypothetical protein [Streptosporangium sp. NPDC049376]|uniref:hypothetical protein n=1 Tax=Streptosporangium sp. NPDC049376 TaxID=3366192 RepID=UPI00378FE3BA